MSKPTAVPSVSVTYAQDGSSTKANELRMRSMPERVYQKHGEQYLPIESPPASGKSRALMFVALDKLENQGLQQVIIAVPEKSIGASFHDEPLSQFGFWADWHVEPRWNLCDAPGGDNGGKVDAVQNFLNSNSNDRSNPHQMFNVKLRSVPWRIESMFAVSNQSPKLTPDEYFAWEEQQCDRHEYINGEVYAMSGGTQNHSRISLKFGALLDSHLSNGDCRVFNSDCRINLVETNDYTYPDASVSCDRRDKTTTQYITYPCLIVEVLSDSTEGYDRGKKFFRYRQNPQLQDYVLVSSQEIAIDLYRKTENERWEIINYRAGDIVELQSVNLSFPIEQAYRGIDFSDVTTESSTPEKSS